MGVLLRNGGPGGPLLLAGGRGLAAVGLRAVVSAVRHARLRGGAGGALRLGTRAGLSLRLLALSARLALDPWLAVARRLARDRRLVGDGGLVLDHRLVLDRGLRPIGGVRGACLRRAGRGT